MDVRRRYKCTSGLSAADFNVFRCSEAEPGDSLLSVQNETDTVDDIPVSLYCSGNCPVCGIHYVRNRHSVSEIHLSGKCME